MSHIRDTDPKPGWHAVVLCSSTDDGRYPLNSQCPMAGWPILGTTCLERLIRELIRQEATSISVCYSGDHPFWQEIKTRDFGCRIQFLAEEMPVGSAGAVRQALQGVDSGTVVVMTGHLVGIPSFAALVAAHSNSDAHFSLLLNADESMADICVCDTSIKEHIPDAGFCDIKELLIPLLLQAGKTVRPLSLQPSAIGFSDWVSYRESVLANLDDLLERTDGLNCREDPRENGGQVWSSDTTRIAESCRVYGNVVVMEGSDIGDETVLIGPSVIGPHARIGSGSIVNRSVLWPNVKMGDRCLVKGSILGCRYELPSAEVVQDQAVVSLHENAWKDTLQPEPDNRNRSVTSWRRYITLTEKTRRIIGMAGILGLVTCCFLWSYWANLKDLWRTWLHSDEYSSGLLVPFLAVYILWLRRNSLKWYRPQPWLWGLVFLAGSQLFRLFGLYYMYGSAERLSIVLSIWALTALMGGKILFKKVFSVLLFLLLMLPWPNRVQLAITLPLQTLATDSAVYSLQTLGYDVIREGHVLHIGDTSVAVAEACNGLRMITAFFVIAALVVLVIERPFWEKCLIMLSSLPIALVCNTIRLTLTSISFTLVSGETWEQIFHDFGGYAMMPVALGMIVLELWLFKLLTTDPSEKKDIIVRRRLDPSEEISR